MTVNTLNTYTQEGEVEGSQIQGESRLHNDIIKKKNNNVVVVPDTLNLSTQEVE